MGLRHEGKPLALSSGGGSGSIGRLFRATTLGSRLRVRRPRSIGQNIPIFDRFSSPFARVQVSYCCEERTAAGGIYDTRVCPSWDDATSAAGGRRERPPGRVCTIETPKSLGRVMTGCPASLKSSTNRGTPMSSRMLSRYSGSISHAVSWNMTTPNCDRCGVKTPSLS